jgi:hypothetical protein
MKAPAFKVVESTHCTLCGKELWYGEVVHENENRTEFMCSNCYDSVVAMGKLLAPDTPVIREDEANAIAARWARGETSPEDFDPRVHWWQSEEAVDEAIRLGYVHRKQRQAEIDRRRDSGQFRKQTTAFVDQYPIKGYGKNEGFGNG